jgi:Holliday junction DNA helicase RuvA
MIGRIAGIIIEKTPPHILIDCMGVGYEVAVPMSTFYNLPALFDVVNLKNTGAILRLKPTFCWCEFL